MEVDGSRNALDNQCEENGFEKQGSSGPVVYQLVRVEGDGTLVPATEDEVLQFEHFLRDEKVDLPSIEDVGHVEELFSNDCMSMKKSDSEDDSSKLEAAAVGTDKLCAGLEERRLQSLDDSLGSPLKYTVVHDQQPDKLHSEQGDNNTAHQENASTETAKSTVLNDSSIAEKDNTDACSRPADDSCTRQTHSQVTSSVPDFSILRGEVCLDDLTIRELQEAFRATFGRQTTVKDKIWLKRRITMGLTNSCDVPSSGCVVKDYKIFSKDGKHVISNTKETPEVELQSISLVKDQVINHVDERSSPSSSYCQSEDRQGSSKRLKRVPITNDEPQRNLLAEQCTIKRIRKPTKRFIEELSDTEAHDSPGKLSSPTERVTHDEVLKLTPFHEVNSSRTSYPTRKDTLGGLSVHVPYVSRMRRGRPRKDFISFVDNKPSVEGIEAQTTVGLMMEKDGKEGNHMRKAFEAPPTLYAAKGGHIEAVDNKGVHKLQTNATNAVVKPKINRAFTRKHHRAWTLCEVKKLVHGVELYGAGKWSEIRKLAFSSYSYRTSVDLKDKWRNLIRASKTQLPGLEDGGCPRKTNPSIIPIPSSILSRVKELNELQSQGGGFTAPVKFSGPNSKGIQGKGSGFL